MKIKIRSLMHNANGSISAHMRETQFTSGLVDANNFN